MLPTITSYGQYSNDNYGAHSLMVKTEFITVYYSYETIVAYRDSEDGLVVSENIWGTTTGKHLNWINSNKNLRVKYEKFQQMLAAALKRHII